MVYPKFVGNAIIPSHEYPIWMFKIMGAGVCGNNSQHLDLPVFIIKEDMGARRWECFALTHVSVFPFVLRLFQV